MKKGILFLFLCMAIFSRVGAQDESPFITYDVPSQNLLKYNRFLINPTFSTVREDKSYFNLLHRNQSVQFDDNNQLYFLSYSGRISDRTGLGLSLYTQREGLVSNYGVLANYAYGIKLNDKSNFTFGANVSYYNSGFDESRANSVEDDPFLNGFQDNSLLSFQPGFNISYGKFDFGVFAENLFDYNLKTNTSLTSFDEKTFSGHLQYTHAFDNAGGILEEGRVMPLARVRKMGEEELALGGSLILDLPKLGWLQGGYDSFYGASAGIGFNLNRRLSLGYTMEKGLSGNTDNFGLTHEISFAYSFTPNLTEDRVMLENEQDALVSSEDEEEELSISDKDAEIAELKRRLEENDAILAELVYRQDSVEKAQQQELERRFEMVMRMVRNETGGNRPDLEEKARQQYFINNERAQVASQEETKRPTIIKPTGMPAEKARKKIEEKPVVAEVSQDNISPAKAERKAAKSRTFRDLQEVEEGYYVIANVYKGGKYMTNFISALQAEGIDAGYIDNPRNGLKYVYLQRFNSKEEAMRAYNTGLDGKYDGDLWIMNVDNRYTNEAYAANAKKIQEKSAGYENNVLQKNVVARDKVAASENKKEPQLGRKGSEYYIIANVFANPNNANRFVKLLNSQGLSASYFINPKNNYRYVYLKRHDSWNNALISYYTKLDASYDDTMWIMKVPPNLIT
ncbi:PorP/SprF family type IX secretion system membrane protein [Zeaxanthinibacter enoshimensis]|uniref:Type IX secretion system PorP/SprF family membrane protein n=1 Tax=Zeaxanthinibacter enoshimensis TaxID=392009 RepID=A0A4R6TQT2_9FLAO|nr:type IX secretion system membrane protein PorP/SprF [Zeaxanthinibacter enoshimensis]TDQ32816.1 type IX secretion system PorP/SprF family membrane protein [Zeaxanthinibacter enoshimensis]